MLSVLFISNCYLKEYISKFCALASGITVFVINFFGFFVSISRLMEIWFVTSKTCRLSYKSFNFAT